MRGVRFLALVGAFAGTIGTAVAVAATVGLSSAKLTTYTAASTVALGTCTLSGSSADAYVDQSNAGTNFGAAASLHVRTQNGNKNKRTFVKHDLASCGIPASARVTTATLKLYLATAPAATRTYDLARVSAAWGEGTITWTNQPAVGAVSTSTATGTTSGVTLQWNVTSDVQAWVSGTANNGFRIADSSEGQNPAREGQFDSREGATPSQRPNLLVSYYP